MKNNKLVKAAEGAKKAGYNYLASIIMVKDGKRLYNIIHVDDLIRIGKWMPAVFQATGTLPGRTINKAEALRRFGK